MERKILIVEDDITFGKMLESWFEKNGFVAVLHSTVKNAKKEISKQGFDLVLTDLRLPDEDGIMLLTWIKEQKSELPVIIMTSYAEISNAVSAIKLGALDYLAKPINPSILKEKIEQVWNNPSHPPVKMAVKENRESPEIVQGKSKISQKMYEHIQLVAPTRMSVLIFGESGTGKEYTARLIHEYSLRKNAPFIAVDCGSLSKELAPSELFGHLKGSFTSAIGDKKGVFEQAYGGTVFLDEIGNLSYEVQVQLLRTLQEQKVRPVGSATDVKIDIRIVAATNENLEVAISQGKFREDLYHRLNEFIIEVPPIRERVEDIPVFVDYFLKEANRELDKQIKSVSEEAMDVLKKHYWSGNLRELRNVIRRASLFAQTDQILLPHLPPLQIPSKIKEDTFFALRSENEKEQIETALKKANGNKTVAARLLKIDRKTLYNKMHLYEIEL
ncbi:MAG: sigma-54 dependent transcriptional regulator [Bacteroidales bacterium]|jgi:two-component system response regulator HydG|nr:sigma-54 dependent transcriptional regulator [Bacteroidales bacterium]